MPTYRYFTTDTLTGQVLGELPLYGVYCDKKIKAAGNFTGTFKLGTGVHNDLELIDASYPVKSCMYVERDGVICWGGIIWSRTFESNAKTVQLSGQTFESYPGSVLIQNDFSRIGANQLQTLVDLFGDMQSVPRRDLQIDTSGVDITGGNLRDLTIKAVDTKYYSEAINQLADADDGFDWFISVGDGQTKELIVGQPIIASDPNNVEVFDFPGNIDQFYWPESGSKGGTDFFLIGSGSGDDAIIASATWPDAAGFPEVDQIVPRKDITDPAILQSIANAYAATFGSSISNPTITLKSDVVSNFSPWNSLGTYFRFELESPRWPERKVVTKRALGWQLYPTSSEQSETFKLVIEGEDEGA